MGKIEIKLRLLIITLSLFMRRLLSEPWAGCLEVIAPELLVGKGEG